MFEVNSNVEEKFAEMGRKDLIGVFTMNRFMLGKFCIRPARDNAWAVGDGISLLPCVHRGER